MRINLHCIGTKFSFMPRASQMLLLIFSFEWSFCTFTKYSALSLTWVWTVEVSNCLWSSTGLLSRRIAANFLVSGVATRGGRTGVSRTLSRRPRGVWAAGVRGEEEYFAASAAASSCDARVRSSSLSERSLLDSLQPHSSAERALAKASSAVSSVRSLSSPRSNSASSRSLTPLRWMTSRSAQSSSSSGRGRDVDAEADEWASLPHDVSVLKPESWNLDKGDVAVWF